MQYTQLSRRSAGGGKIDWEKQYLTFIPVEDAVFSWAERAVSGHLEYSINGGQTWVTIANGESTPTVSAGNKIMWRGDLVPKSSASGGIGTFASTANYDAVGSVMSLLYGDDYSEQVIIEYTHSFVSLFKDNTHLLSAPELPAITLSKQCYYNMFNGCSSLTTAPVLPATTLTDYCYYSMFSGCSSLTTAPVLPATTTPQWCYALMFSNCTSLVVAPELPAITLSDYCYLSMFSGCTKLNYVKCLATNISVYSSINSWLRNVAATGTFVKAASMTSWPSGENGIPSGWTVLDDNS